MKIKYFIDMDGVLAKWNTSASEEDTHQPGYFLNREPENSAISLVKILKESGADVNILSAVYDNAAAEEKTVWLKNNGLGNINRIFCPYGKNKYNYVDARDSVVVLIDDYGKNLKEWQKNDGIAFKFFNNINNRPKLTIEDDSIKVSSDTWDGFSIDYRMKPQEMAIVVSSISEALSKNVYNNI